MKIAVIGAGYVGLVTAVCLSEVGHDVMVVDNDMGRITLLQAGTVPIQAVSYTHLTPPTNTEV